LRMFSPNDMTFNIQGLTYKKETKSLRNCFDLINRGMLLSLLNCFKVYTMLLLSDTIVQMKIL